MNKEYVINHLNIGLFIKELMEQTSIYSLEIDICEKNLLFFPSFLNNKSQIVEWYEKPQDKVVTYHFSEPDSIFLPQEQTLPQFTDSFFDKFPLAKNNKHTANK